MDRQLDHARALIAELVQEHPELALADELPAFQGCTNRILFGSYGDKPVVFKCFVTPDRKHHEKKMLQLMAPSGTVPRLYPVETDDILVMERLPGEALHGKLWALTDEEKAKAFRHIGSAFARVVVAEQEPSAGSGTVAPAPGIDLNFYRDAQLPVYYDWVVDTGLRALKEHDVPERDLLSNTLRALQDRRDEVLAFQPFVHQDDVHLNNLVVDGIRFSGFVDLEMCRQGNEVLLLAAALAMCLPTPELWPSMRSGYEETHESVIDQRMIDLVRHTTAFSQLIRFAWYWGTDELPQWAIADDMRSVIVRHIVRTVTMTNELL